MRPFVFMLLLLAAVNGRLHAAADAREYYESGMKALQNGDPDQAVAQLKKALEVSPPWVAPQILNAMGIAYLQKQNAVGDAIYSFEEALRRNPAYAEAYLNLGTLYAGLRSDPELAQEYFEKAIQLDPKSSKGYMGLGWVHLLSKQDAKQAAEMFQKAVDISPQLARAHLGLGLAYVAMGKRSLALKPISVLRSMNEAEMAARIEATMKDGAEKKEEPAPADEIPIPVS